MTYLLEHPLLVPRVAVPEVIYFTSSETTFARAWRYIGQGLEKEGCCVYEVGCSLEAISKFFSLFKKALLQFGKTELENWRGLKSAGNAVAHIYLRTMEHHRLKTLQKDYMEEDRALSVEKWKEMSLDHPSLLRRHPQVRTSLSIYQIY